MNHYPEKKKSLLQKMKAYAARDVMVAFSGGVDSALLLKLACDAAAESGKKVYAVTVQTRLHPPAEMEEAGRICAQIGADSLGYMKIEDFRRMTGELPLCKACFDNQYPV